MVFPNWGAISANIVNAQNKKDIGLVGEYKPTRKPTKKDWVIAILIMTIPCIIIWIAFIIWMSF
jgi:hypothetical protein